MDTRASLYFLLFVLLTSTAKSDNDTQLQTPKRRAKRFLSMRPGQRFLFRINAREDAVYNIKGFAHGWGFRANYEILQPLHSFPFHFISRRDVHDEVENLVDLYGISGKDCILKAFCDVTNGNFNGGMMFKAFKIIFGKLEKYNDEPFDCEHVGTKCPLSLLQLYPYTDFLP